MGNKIQKDENFYEILNNLNEENISKIFEKFDQDKNEFFSKEEFEELKEYIQLEKKIKTIKDVKLKDYYTKLNKFEIVDIDQDLKISKNDLLYFYKLYFNNEKHVLVKKKSEQNFTTEQIDQIYNDFGTNFFKKIKVRPSLSIKLYSNSSNLIEDENLFDTSQFTIKKFDNNNKKKEKKKLRKGIILYDYIAQEKNELSCKRKKYFIFIYNYYFIFILIIKYLKIKI
jgi:hypothetical protein